MRAERRLQTRLQDCVDVNRGRRVEYVPEEWRVVTGRAGGNVMRRGGVLLSIWIVVVVRWGPRGRLVIIWRTWWRCG